MYTYILITGALTPFACSRSYEYTWNRVPSYNVCASVNERFWARFTRSPRFGSRPDPRVHLRIGRLHVPRDKRQTLGVFHNTIYTGYRILSLDSIYTHFFIRSYQYRSSVDGRATHSNTTLNIILYCKTYIILVLCLRLILGFLFKAIRLSLIKTRDN